MPAMMVRLATAMTMMAATSTRIMAMCATGDADGERASLALLFAGEAGEPSARGPRGRGDREDERYIGELPRRVEHERGHTKHT